MYFQHSDELWAEFPALVPGVFVASGITPGATVDSRLPRFYSMASDRLSQSPEGELPEIQAWRRTFSAMGLKPTQYRCAAESLLRRFRKEGSLPRLHPVIDICNAISLAYAVPIAVFDVSEVVGGLEVRHANGSETYLTFGGEVEQPAAGEVIFADASGQAHARRWTNRQSATSAIRPTTSDVLIVAEALHPTADADVPEVMAAVAQELGEIWAVDGKPVVLSRAASRFEW
jgi:DNA/RNA-binding domain of Phe-tRNA-synthetase-like protein